MVYGIGNDIIETERLRKTLNDGHKGTFFTDKEMEEIAAKKTEDEKLQRITMAFSGKEAVAKALGTGFASCYQGWMIEILHDKMGAPYVLLHGLVEEFAKEHGVTKVMIAFSGVKEYVTSFAVAITD
ncbi:MAG: 4'-phosphopantetheinyl transferase superfamily protein [Lachnospiraceae bacterium]|nr:4'-phosphopantetheinyl transferase superfamily protein [Lachnospiraceae bacterium]